MDKNIAHLLFLKYQKISSIDFNEDFAYSLGLLITDGHIVYNKIKKRYKSNLYTSYPKEKNMIRLFTPSEEEIMRKGFVDIQEKE